MKKCVCKKPKKGKGAFCRECWIAYKRDAEFVFEMMRRWVKNGPAIEQMMERED